MANYNVDLSVGVGKGSYATFQAVGGKGLTSGNPLEVEIGDTITFVRNTSSAGRARFHDLSIFTDNSNIVINTGEANVTRTVASGGTTANEVTGHNNGETVSDSFFLERQAAAPATPTYSFSVNNMNEGVSQTVYVTTTNVANGTTLYFSIDGNPTSDFSATSGSFTITSNSGSFTLTTTADQTTENTETFAIRVRTGSTSGTTVASTTFNVINTSSTPAPTYSLGSASALNEGSYQNISVTTTNFGSGTLYYTLSPSADFTTSSGSVSITNNSGSITVTASDDSTTEGAETGTLRLRTGSTTGTVVATRTFTINDTSTGGSSSSGGSSTGSGTGGDTYGIEIYGPNGSTTVLGNNLRAQSVIYFATSTFNNNQTYTYTGIPNANDSSKTQIIADFLGGSTNVPVTIIRYSNYFTIKQTSGSSRTARLVVIRIA